MYTIEDFDKQKTIVLKYIIYKKRTENEVRKKFEDVIEEGLLEDIIQYLKDAKYIDDCDYIEKMVSNFQKLKNLSVTELKYKLVAKGLDRNLIEDYFYENKEELIEYEIKSAYNIIQKKRRDLKDDEIKMFLLKKGYKNDNINNAFGED